MPRLKTAVRVASPQEAVVDRFNAAVDNPSMVVEWFTSTTSVDAEVVPAGDRSWSIRVKATAFQARGRSEVAPSSASSSVSIDLDIKPTGLLGRAAVLAAVASGQVESEIRKTLWREFGRPEEDNDG